MLLSRKRILCRLVTQCELLHAASWVVRSMWFRPFNISCSAETSLSSSYDYFSLSGLFASLLGYRKAIKLDLHAV